MEQVRTKARNVFELVEKMTEEEILNKLNAAGCTSKKEAVIMVPQGRQGQVHKDLEESLEVANRDMRSILGAKSNGEAEEKMEGWAQGEGPWAYFRIHLVFTRATAQGRSLRRAAIMSPARLMRWSEIDRMATVWSVTF